MNLPFDQTVQYDLVIGLSDLHIKNHSNDRQRNRYDDYHQTFDHLTTQLKQLTINRHPVIVICGDVFDIKDRLTTYAVRLFNQLIKHLTNLAPVLIFKGNHDYISVDGRESDLIGCLVDQFPSNLYYLSQTGTYLLGNLGFSYLDILDLIKTGSTCDKTDQLPPFPDQYGVHTQVKIGLLHGTLNGSSLANHRFSSTGYPLKWIENAGHDYVIMGDNHTQQILGQKQQMCYCSSLIQQNFGEPFIEGHGFVVLDLDQDSCKEGANHLVARNHQHRLIMYNVTCPTGQVYLSYRDQFWINSQTHQSITELITHPNCPTKWIISIRGHATPEQIEILTDHLRNNSIEYQLVRDLVNICEDQTTLNLNLNSANIEETEMTDLSRYNCPSYWKEFIYQRNPIISLDFIEHPQTLLISHQSDFTNKCNQDLQLLITEHQKQMVCTVTRQRLTFRLLDAQWSWLLPYGDRNSFNFEKCRGQLTCISGLNSAGKSALTEILMIGLFGLSTYHTGIPSRHQGSHDSTVILNRHKPDDTNACVTVDFLLEGQRYQVSRTFSLVKDKITTTECRIISEGQTLYSGTTGVKDFIEKKIGDPQTFLMSVLISQNNDYDLFKMDKKEQIMLFDQLLNLQSYNSFMTFVKSVGDKYKRCLQQAETTYACLINHYQPFDATLIPQTEQALAQHQSQLISLKTELSQIVIPNDLKQEDLEQELEPETPPTPTPTLDQPEQDCDPELLVREQAIYRDKLRELGRYSNSNSNSNSNHHLDHPRQRLAQMIRVNQPTRPLDQCQQQLAKLSDIMVNRDHLVQYQTQLTCLRETQPNRPEVTQSQIQQFQQQHEAFLEQMTALKNPLISTSSELAQFCQEHPIITNQYQYTVSQLTKLIQNDQKKLTSPDWYDQPSNVFEETLQQITFNYQSLVDQIQTLDQTIEVNQQEHQQLIGQTQTIDCQMTNLRRQITTNPAQRTKWLNHQSEYTDQQYQSKTQQLSQLERMIEQKKQLTILKKQQDTLSNQITVLNEAHKIHNPECWACRQRKWVTNLEQLKNQLEQVTTQIDLIDSGDSVESSPVDPSNQILIIQQWIKQYHKREHLDQQIQLDGQLSELDNQKQDLLKQSQTVKAEGDRLRQTKTKLNRQLTEWEPKYKSVVFARDQRDKWRHWDQELLRLKDNQKMVIYHQLLTSYQDLNVPYYTVQAELTVKYDQYVNQKQLLESQIEKCHLLETLDDWERFDHYQQQLTDIYVSILDEIETQLSVHYWNLIRRYQPLYRRSQLIKQDIELQTQRFYQVESQLANYRQQLESSQRTQTEMINLGHLIGWLKHQISNMTEVSTIMVDFRHHLYQTIILPTMTSKVNEMVGLITNQSDFRLTGHMNEGDGQIQWLINGDLPARSGGFAMNLNSLCIKIVLSRLLNYSPIVSECLILDECFVQSDSDKISEISQFLTGMLSIYGTVIVISHIQSIVEVCEMTVIVEKKNGISYVRWNEMAGKPRVQLKLKPTPEPSPVSNSRVKLTLRK